MKLTWRSLNDSLNNYSEKQVKDLLQQELHGLRRRTVLERLHQRYNALRVARERMEIFENVANYAKISDKQSDNEVGHYAPKLPLQTLPITSFTFTNIAPLAFNGSNSHEVKVPKKLACHQAVAFIKPLIANKLGAFGKGIIGSPFHKLCEELSRQNLSGQPIRFKDLAQALHESGWIDRGRVSSRQFNTKRHVFIHPEYDHMSKSQISRLFEAGPS